MSFNDENESATLLINCMDKKGIVASVANFISSNNGNIVSLEQHIDGLKNMFFMRVKWDIKDFKIKKEDINFEFQKECGEKFEIKWQIFFSNEKPKIALFVSKLSHCLYDILYRYYSGEWNVDIPLIISNHKDLQDIAEKFSIKYEYFPINKENKLEQEEREKELLKKHNINLVVLARYMQILSSDFVKEFPNKIINIHHSFLPAFPGARPYDAAYNRGVKIIGVTSHYVTEELDAGPIIEQDVVKVSHTDSIEDIIRKGKDLEKVVLSRSVQKHIRRKILTYNNKTIVFD